jgi:hypothetical protein
MCLLYHISSQSPTTTQVGVICQYVIVIELHKTRIFIYIPYAKDQIWTFNLAYIYAICLFAI